MKKITRVFVLAAALTASAVLTSQAQIVVRVRPERPRVVRERPVAPSPRHVWVDEDWTPRGHGYVYSGGRWVLPPREHAVYVPGHWDRRGRGHVWIAATWR